MTRPPCDVCGKPATNAARDVYEIDRPESEYIHNEPGRVKYGCDDHPPKSETIEVRSAYPRDWGT